jgi:UDP-glucose 4-epimerase
MRTLITGGAGFIGGELCRELSRNGHSLTVLDNLSSGKIGNLRNIRETAADFRFIKGDCKNPRHLRKSLKDVQTVFHFAANPEVRLDRSDPLTCFNENVVATHTLLEQIKDSDVENVVFASSSTVYGEAKIIPTPEDYGPLEPISIYGGSKLSSEALLSAYCHTYDRTAVILRFANIIGPKNEHGVVRDFLEQTKNNPRRLTILGDGHQKKSYLHIDDCVQGIIDATEAAKPGVNVFNVGSEDQVEVLRIAEIVMEEADRIVEDFDFREGGRGGSGWNGDVKNMLLDVTKLKSKGWTPRHSSEEAVILTVRSSLHSDTRARVSHKIMMK